MRIWPSSCYNSGLRRERLSGHQHTLASAVSLSGIGLHTGVTVNLRLCPAPVHSGIVFKRTDLDGFVIEAESRHVARVSYATSLMQGCAAFRPPSTCFRRSRASESITLSSRLTTSNAHRRWQRAALCEAIRESVCAASEPAAPTQKFWSPSNCRMARKKIAVYPSESFAVSYQFPSLTPRLETSCSISHRMPPPTKPTSPRRAPLASSPKSRSIGEWPRQGRLDG